MQIAQRWILFRLRDRVFFDIEELNAEIRSLTVQLNEHRFKKLPGSRRERFEADERATLRSLPAMPFEKCEWRHEVRVGDDYHVEFAQLHYSVPCYLAGQRVDQRSTRKVLEVFHGGRRVALHVLSSKVGDVVTVAEHRPVAHQRILEAEPRALLDWPERVGVHATKMIRHHLEDRKDPTNGLRAARKLRELARSYATIASRPFVPTRCRST